MALTWQSPRGPEQCFSTGPHADSKTTGPIMDSGGGEASSPALAVRYPLLFSAQATDQATGQPQ